MTHVAGGDRHVFRFFAAGTGAPGATLELDAFDTRHARVLHGAQAGAPVELVDDAGVLWLGHFDGPTGRVILDERIGEVRERPIELLAFVSVGGRTDELVDAAVQAGATRIVPLVAAARDRAKVDARAERLARIATTAAKQSKRASVPRVTEALDGDELLAGPAGIVVDPDSDVPLDQAVRDHGGPLRLLLGASDGFPAGLVESLVARGWSTGRLGPTILRAELAAAVAVTIAAMHRRDA